MAFVQYVFAGKPHCILQKPHGNAKHDHKPFIRTTPSTLQKLKLCSKKLPPRQAVSKVTTEKGGVLKANSVGSIPRNRKQVYNISCREAEDNDALLSVMVMCKESMGRSDDPFVRIVTSAPEPMSILCTNAQLLDIEHFCTDPLTFGPLSVDPTFDLGDFNVTVTSYRNLLLRNRKTRKNPVMVGPMLIHCRKLFSSYHFLASQLVCLKPSLSQLQAFGTDGEECLYTAFSTQFPNARHLRCFLHFRDNCKAKLHELKAPNHVAIIIIQDIFGSFLKGKEGLVDANDVYDLHCKLQSLKTAWESLVPDFFDWFVKNKLLALETSMLKPVRQASGLGNPPEPFYTNDVESINRVIKRKTDYRTSEWPDFCRLARELVDEQEGEIEKAVIGVGEYIFNDDYEHLEVPVSKWSSMSQLQRKKHLQKVRTISLGEASKVQQPQRQTALCSNLPDSPSTSGAKIFTISGQVFDASACQLSCDILANMFIKAERLVSVSGNICLSPGSSTSKLVASKSGQRPHFVQRKTDTKYCCDSECQMWRCSKLCSHTIACAFQDGNLQQFISHVTGQPSFYALAKSGTTEKAGKKPSKRKASSKATTKVISDIQEEILPANITSGISVQPMPSSSSQTPNVTLQSQAEGTIRTKSGTSSQASNSGVYISQATFANSAVNFLSKSPVCSVSQIQSSPLASTSVKASVLPCSGSYSLGSIPTSLQPQQVPNNRVLSSLISQVLAGARSNAIDPNHLFWLMLVSGNISRCQGCSGKILRGADGKPLPPPDDIVLQHKEQVLFQNPKTGLFQLSHDLRNVYYHARLPCIMKKFQSFQPGMHIRIAQETLNKLSEAHKSCIQREFGVNF